MIFNLPESDWDAVIRVHLRGHYSTVRPASAYWREQRDPHGHYRIINFTSLSGLDGAPGQPNYAAAKMGVVGLTYSLAQSLARYGVTANAIAPAAATRMIGENGMSPDARPDLAPENIAPIALYLASERSDWLTGRVLSAQGYEVGLYANPQVIRHVSAPGPWHYENLAAMVAADGLPDSIFRRLASN
jgi:NAD(P)-dependent dehydrogenase (short-subunit alcohol dehydrogenase family)